MYDPYHNPNGSDSELGQLEKTDRNPVQEARYQQLKTQADASDPIKQAQAKIDAQNTANQTANDARFASDRTDLTNFNNTYQAAVPGIINSTSQKYNLGGLLAQANGLGNRVSELSGNTMGTGAGGYASSDQVDKAVQTNYLPRYQQAVQNLNNGTQLAQSEEGQLIAPYTTQASLLNDRMAREATNFTTEQQNELASLVSQMQSGVTLTTDQMDNANKLATQQLAYESALATANASIKVAQIGQQYQPLSPNQQLFSVNGNQPATNIAGGSGAHL